MSKLAAAATFVVTIAWPSAAVSSQASASPVARPPSSTCADAGLDRLATTWTVRCSTVADGLLRVELQRAPPTSSQSAAPTPSATIETPTYVIVVGERDRQPAADALLAEVEALGLQAVPVYGSGRYQVRVAGIRNSAGELVRFNSADHAEQTRRGLLASFSDAQVETLEPGTDPAAPNGPFAVQALLVDPRSIDVVVAHARDAAFGLETTRDLARRRGALAAINGGFFRMTGLLAGESEGVLVMAGELLSEPDRGRSGVGFFEVSDSEQAAFGRLGFSGTAQFGNLFVVPLDGINRERRATELILFTPELHRTTLTPPGGVEVIVRQDHVVAVRRGPGSSTIPVDGYVLSFGSEHPKLAEAAALRGTNEATPPGSPVAVTVARRLVALSPDPADEWSRVSDALGAGPLLLLHGERVTRPDLEAISRVFAEARHPRTAVAARADGTLILITVDGRNLAHSAGMSLPELTDLLLELGAIDAVNLDGGGSTTMVIHGETVNRPSDPNGERANGDAILLFPRQRSSAHTRAPGLTN